MTDDKKNGMGNNEEEDFTPKDIKEDEWERLNNLFTNAGYHDIIVNLVNLTIYGIIKFITSHTQDTIIRIISQRWEKGTIVKEKDITDQVSNAFMKTISETEEERKTISGVTLSGSEIRQIEFYLLLNILYGWYTGKLGLPKVKELRNMALREVRRTTHRRHLGMSVRQFTFRIIQIIKTALPRLISIFAEGKEKDSKEVVQHCVSFLNSSLGLKFISDIIEEREVEYNKEPEESGEKETLTDQQPTTADKKTKKEESEGTSQDTSDDSGTVYDNSKKKRKRSENDYNEEEVTGEELTEPQTKEIVRVQEPQIQPQPQQEPQKVELNVLRADHDLVDSLFRRTDTTAKPMIHTLIRELSWELKAKLELGRRLFPALMFYFQDLIRPEEFMDAEKLGTRLATELIGIVNYYSKYGVNIKEMLDELQKLRKFNEEAKRIVDVILSLFPLPCPSCGHMIELDPLLANRLMIDKYIYDFIYGVTGDSDEANQQNI